MPLYLFKCFTCGEQIEKLQKLGEANPDCKCGVGMVKLPTPFQFRVKDGGNLRRSKGYKEDYSKEYLRDVSPETYA